jgi:hypothetical protein
MKHIKIPCLLGSNKEIEVYDTIIHDNIDREELWANMVTNLFNINFIKAEIWRETSKYRHLTIYDNKIHNRGA